MAIQRLTPTIHTNTISHKIKISAKFKRILLKVWDIAKKVLYGCACIALYFTNPSLFAIGFISGIIWDKKVQEVIDKVVSIWKKHKIEMTLLGGAATILSLPVTWAVASFGLAANLSSRISLNTDFHGNRTR